MTKNINSLLNSVLKKTEDQKQEERKVFLASKSDNLKKQLPVRYQESSLSLFPSSTVKDIWLGIGKGGFFIPGDTGIGKTLFAAALILERLERNCPASFWRCKKDVFCDTWFLPDNCFIFAGFHEILSEIKKSFTTKEAVEQKYKNCNVLVIDDLGTGKISNWELSAISEIINYRYQEMKETIITSNLSLPDLIKLEYEILGTDRMGDRIKTFHEVILPNINRRKKG